MKYYGLCEPVVEFSIEGQGGGFEVVDYGDPGEGGLPC